MAESKQETVKGADRAPSGVNRRGFLRAIGGTGAVAAATVAPGMVGEAEAYDPGTSETKARYRESEHVKTFYKTNRY
jgi:hypothetical protein